MNDVLTAALELHAAGYSVLPTRGDRTKAPAVAEWKPFTQTRATERQVRAWFTRPGDGLAVIQGAVSGNAELTELEGRAAHHLPALARLATDTGLSALWARLSQGWVERSPSGGYHFHYRVDGPVAGNTRLAADPKRQVLAETRGEGGYVIVAPTPGTHHQTGLPWERVAGGPTTTPTITLAERAAFHALLASLDETPTPSAPAPVATPHVSTEGLTPGDDFEAKTDWVDILTPHGWTLTRTQGAARYWTRPNKNPRDGISASTGRADDRDRLYVWSTSTEFNTDTSYTKFGAYAVLNHGGDHAAAARELARNGYGTNPATTHATTADLLALLAPTEQQATTPNPSAHDHTGAPSWAPIDLTGYLDGTHQADEPTMLVRDDDVALLYPGLVHDFHGESESGKSLVVQAEAATQVKLGNDVLYVDFESGPGPIAQRMTDLGCTPEQLVAHFVYIRPEGSPYALTELPAWEALLGHVFALGVLDGVTDALGQFGAASKDNDDIAKWHRAVPRMLATRTGAAVVLIDHVVKSTDGRGRFAIGGQSKMAAIDGASYSVEVTEPIGKGMRGTITLRIAKDRPGEIRPHCGTWRATDRTQEAALVVIDSTDGPINVQVLTPDTQLSSNATPQPKTFRPTGVMEKLSRILETRRQPITQTQLRLAYREDGGKGKNATFYDAVNLLVDEGYVLSEEGSRNARMLRSAQVYRQRNDPSSDAFEAALENLITDRSTVPPPFPDRSGDRSSSTPITHSQTTVPPFPDRSPTVPRNGQSTVPPPPPPVGGVGNGSVSRNTATDPRRLDPLTGHLFDPETGEVLS